jgi:hypothetical protein
MILATHHAIVLIASLAAMPLLARARWPERAPRTAIVCWQVLLAAFVSAASTLPLAIALAPNHVGLLPGLLRLLAGSTPALPAGRTVLLFVGLATAGWFAWSLLRCAVRTERARRRHRWALSLVSQHDPRAPGTSVLDHPAPLAYCLPGRSGTVVVSRGTLRTLDPRQLAAVLAHERAHLAERHDLVLLPFAALRQALPRCRPISDAAVAVAELIEMCADDRARTRCEVAPLTTALGRFDAAAPPPGTLGVGARADTPLAVRTRRLLHPRPGPSILFRCTAIAASLTLALTPLSLLALPG